jgi:hypothetical protein
MSVLPAYRAGNPGSLLAIDADALSWRDAVVTNGGSVSAGRLNLVSILIAGLKAGGSWSLDDDLWLLVAENSIQALTSIKQRRLTTAVNSPTFAADLGYAFDGAANYLDTLFIPNTHKVAMAQDNVRLAAYVRNNTTSAGYACGVNSNGSRVMRLRPRTSGTTSTTEANAGSATFTLPAADVRGLFSASRSAANAASTLAFKNSASLTRTSDPASFATTGLPVHSLYIGCQNNAATAATFSAFTTGFVVIGAVLSSAQELAEYNAVQAYMAALGAEV